MDYWGWPQWVIALWYAFWPMLAMTMMLSGARVDGKAFARTCFGIMVMVFILYKGGFF